MSFVLRGEKIVPNNLVIKIVNEVSIRIIHEKRQFSAYLFQFGCDIKACFTYRGIKEKSSVKMNNKLKFRDKILEHKTSSWLWSFWLNCALMYKAKTYYLLLVMASISHGRHLAFDGGPIDSLTRGWQLKVLKNSSKDLLIS